MLEPNNRLTLIDAMRPPAGFGLEAAVGVTFTLDLRALLAAPAAFALTSANAITDDSGQLEPIELLHAVRSYASKLTVLSQVGEIALPPSRRVFSFLERSVIPVQAPLRGVVHPKLWALQYASLAAERDDADGEDVLRVLIASRNLTFDASWDTIVRLDESDSRNDPDLAPLAELLAGLISNARIPVSKEHADRVAMMADALREARFAPPRGADTLSLHALGISRQSSPLPTDVDRSLIISPFVTDDFFTDVRAAAVDELVSRTASLDGLDAASLDRIDSAYVFDDGSSVEPSALEDRLTPGDPGRPLRGLHAKVFAFERGNRAQLFLGSANATGAAFSSNVEVLLELTGSVEHLGIDRLRAGTGDEPPLDSLLLPYVKSEPDDEQQVTRLDAARHVIANLTITGLVEQSGEGYAVTYRSLETVPTLDDSTVECWPLSSAGNRKRVATGAILDVRFETTIEAISGFLAFEIAHEDGTITQFVVPVPLENVPEQRERQLLRALVGSAERFLRYLLALLEERGQPAIPDIPDDEQAGAQEGAPGQLALPVLERLLRTMRSDPAKLAALHPLVSDLASDEALPEGFAELWAMIFAVAFPEKELP